MWTEIITKVIAKVIGDLIGNIASRLLGLRTKPTPSPTAKEGKDHTQEGTADDLGNSVAGYIIKSDAPIIQDNVDVNEWDKE